MMRTVPHRPAISNVLIRASANATFRSRLLTDARGALSEMNVPPEDVDILSAVQAPTLREYAQQVKLRLMAHRLGAENS
jgi:hypothetical protein